MVYEGRNPSRANEVSTPSHLIAIQLEPSLTGIIEIPIALEVGTTIGEISNPCEKIRGKSKPRIKRKKWNIYQAPKNCREP